MNERVVVYADKTVLRITGIEVRGLRPQDLEKALADRLQTTVRVIGVTGDSLDVDVYGLEPDAILRDEAGTIAAVSMTPGITAGEVARIASAEKAVDVDAKNLPADEWTHCRAERWRSPDA